MPADSPPAQFDLLEFRQLYKGRRNDFVEARNAVRQIIKGILPKVDPTGLVRTHLIQSRIKSRASLAAKAKKKGWSPQDALSRAPDIIGARVVCENIEDVPRVAELLREALEPRCSTLAVQIHDRKPESGYRATHVNGYLQIGSPLHPTFVPFEVQVRTLLQDAWGKLTHRDVYKGADVPELHRKLAERLADLLDTADQIAQDIREDLTQRKIAPASAPAVDGITPETLAFAFHEVFGRDPAEWAVQSVLAACEELGITDLRALASLIKDPRFCESVEEAYRTSASFPLGHERLFSFLPLAASQGPDAARRAVIELAEQEVAESEAYYRDTVLGDLPETVDEFLDELDRQSDDGDVSHYLHSIASAFAVLSDCAVCGTDIVDADGFESALYDRLGIDEEDGRVANAIRNSGVEVGAWNTTSLCAYHADVAARDD